MNGSNTGLFVSLVKPKVSSDLLIFDYVYIIFSFFFFVVFSPSLLRFRQQNYVVRFREKSWFELIPNSLVG